MFLVVTYEIESDDYKQADSALEALGFFSEVDDCVLPTGTVAAEVNDAHLEDLMDEVIETLRELEVEAVFIGLVDDWTAWRR